jgi:hypothetical protein
VIARGDSLANIWAKQPLMGVPFVVFVALAVWLAYLTLTAMPRGGRSDVDTS